MNPLTLLKEAINEYGSRVILKERLELINDHLRNSEQKQEELEAENKRLRKGNERLKKKNAELSERFSKFEQDTSGLLPEAHEILVFLAENANGKRLLQSHIQSETGLDINRLKYHLSVLEKKQFIHGFHNYMNRESRYELSPKGTKHLMDHGEI